ncbi:MAG: DUF4058 family protein [Caldilineaceae bacterium]
MPSPFPGMDPYLEERSIWPDVHSTLISYIREALQPQVRPKYIARIGERIEVAYFGKSYVPDVMVIEPPRGAVASNVHGGALVADEPLTMAMLDEEYRVPFIEIIYGETGDVVTLIEVLSPANKTGDGREKYINKQNELLDSYVNLVEIDLLSWGLPTTLARNLTIRNPSNWRYMISVSRAHARSRLEMYPIPLNQRLPRCRIPLRMADDDVVLDLPSVFNRCYDVGGYDLLVDYAQEPPVALSDDEMQWLTGWLVEKGVRVTAS